MLDYPASLGHVEFGMQTSKLPTTFACAIKLAGKQKHRTGQGHEEGAQDQVRLDLAFAQDEGRHRTSLGRSIVCARKRRGGLIAAIQLGQRSVAVVGDGDAGQTLNGNKTNEG